MYNSYSYKSLWYRSIAGFYLLHINRKTYRRRHRFCRIWRLLLCTSASSLPFIISCNWKNIFYRPFDLRRLFKCNPFRSNLISLRFIFIKKFKVLAFNHYRNHSDFGIVCTYSKFSDCTIGTSFHFICSSVFVLLRYLQNKKNRFFASSFLGSSSISLPDPLCRSYNHPNRGNKHLFMGKKII